MYAASRRFMTKHIKRLEGLLPQVTQLQSLQRRLISKSPRYLQSETCILSDQLYELLVTPVTDRLAILQQQNFDELIATCKEYDISYLLIANYDVHCITPSELVTNKESNRKVGSRVPIWEVAGKLLSMGCGNGDQAQIVSHGLLTIPWHRTALEWIYGTERCGKVYEIASGNIITDVGVMNSVLAWKIREK